MYITKLCFHVVTVKVREAKIDKMPNYFSQKMKMKQKQSQIPKQPAGLEVVFLLPLSAVK